MYRVDVNKLNGKIVEQRTTKEALADAIGVDRSTFYRRLKANKLLVEDMHKICGALDLSRDDAMEIFMAQ